MIRQALLFFLLGFFMTLVLGQTLTQQSEWHGHQILKIESSSSFTSEVTGGRSAEACTDPCDMGLCHFGHCAFPLVSVPVIEAKALRTLKTSAPLLSMTSVHLDGFRRPPKHA